jgi:hypothetical protein
MDLLIFFVFGSFANTVVSIVKKVNFDFKKVIKVGFHVN